MQDDEQAQTEGFQLLSNVWDALPQAYREIHAYLEREEHVSGGLVVLGAKKNSPLERAGPRNLNR